MLSVSVSVSLTKSEPAYTPTGETITGYAPARRSKGPKSQR
jgi:hypothetical protein